MADEVDQTSDRIDFDTEISIRNTCQQAKKIPVGQPGDCELCGEYFDRVVLVEKGGENILACGRCRDKHRIS